MRNGNRFGDSLGIDAEIKAPSPLFLKGPSPTLRVLLLGILSIVLMVADQRGEHLASLRSALATAIYPVQYAVHLPIEGGTWLATHLESKQALLRQNERLRTERLQLQVRLEKYVSLEAENRRLRGLLDSSARLGERVVVAELLSVDSHPFSKRIVLNKGRNDGVYVGQSLVDSHGILGQVVTASAFSSDALLITDPAHAVPVQIHRTGLRAIAVGAGSSNTMKLLHVPNSAEVRVGDLLVTSGLGGRFPRGYPVGRIRSVSRDTGRPFAEVSVRPAALLERNREVLLVWPQTSGPVAASKDVPTKGQSRRGALIDSAFRQ